MHLTCMHASTSLVKFPPFFFFLFLFARMHVRTDWYASSSSVWLRCRSLLEYRRRWPVEIVGRPEVVDGARPPGIEPVPRLSLAAPVQQADGSRVQAPAPPFDIVAAKPVLVPPVVHALDVSGEHQKEGRQRAEVVDPLLLLHGHPPFHPPRVPAGAPLVHVHHHHAGVEVARAPPVERPAERRVHPKCVREVVGEVGMAVLRCAHHVAREVHGEERADVVDDDHVGVEVDHPAHVGGKRVGKVDARVVERLV
uniref:Uncharacterized protein n=1 Tax=Triticum urartu TaxID=4572 RepID=A0A8R7U6K1_TRIUA